jgi:hypothetical protein
MASIFADRRGHQVSLSLIFLPFLTSVVPWAQENKQREEGSLPSGECSNLEHLGPFSQCSNPFHPL